MFTQNSVLLKESKIRKAEQLKEEKKRWKEEKLSQQKEKEDHIRRKNKELNDLEAAFLEELSKRKPKKQKVKDSKYFIVKTNRNKSPDFNFNSRLRLGPLGTTQKESNSVQDFIISPSRSISPPKFGPKLGENNSNPQESPKILPVLETEHKSTERQTNASENSVFFQKTQKIKKTHLNDSNEIHSGDLRLKDFNSKDLISNSINSKEFNTKDLNSKDFNSKGLNSKNFNSKDFNSKDFISKDFNSKNINSNKMCSESSHRDEESFKSGNRVGISERLTVREKRQKKCLPLILKPVNNGMFMIHIVGDTKVNKAKSENNTPMKTAEDVHSPYFHMFRDVEVVNNSTNYFANSKVKARQDYDKKIKRDFTPKPDINYNLRLESKKLERYLENTVKRVKFLKIF